MGKMVGINNLIMIHLAEGCYAWKINYINIPESMSRTIHP